MKLAVCLLALPAIVSAGFFDDAGLGSFFGSNFDGVNSLAASSQKDLVGNVGKVLDLLKGIKQKLPLLEALADDGQRKTLRQVDGFLQTVTSFSNSVQNGGEGQFGQNSNRWINIAKSIFEAGGLNSVVKLIATQSAGSSTCFIAAAVLPVVYLLR